MSLPAECLYREGALLILSNARENLRSEHMFSVQRVDPSIDDAIHILAKGSRQVFESYLKMAEGSLLDLKDVAMAQAAA
jgi:hypothetical protein